MSSATLGNRLRSSRRSTPVQISHLLALRSRKTCLNPPVCELSGMICFLHGNRTP